LYILLIGGPVLLVALAARNDGLIWRVGVAGARFALWLAGVKVRVEGTERLDLSRTYLFMSNHVGNVDPPAEVVHLPQRVAIIAKHDVFKIPVLGRALRFTGFIPIYRGTAQAASTVEGGIANLRAGRSMLVYPEGTRSPTGEMLPFRRGVFVMAIRAGVPIVPLTITGSRAIMRKGDPRIYPGDVQLIIHDPIPTAGLTEDDRFALAERVREAIASALPEIQTPAPVTENSAKS
ncbi:MAG: lysophospholipid acyltransferase family protein, partial [Gammaproteobacteria bacterium]